MTFVIDKTLGVNPVYDSKSFEAIAVQLQVLSKLEQL